MDKASAQARTGRQEDARNFGIERRTEVDGTARLILRGELDMATQGDLHEALLAEQRAGTSVVVVLDQLDYLDSAGIGELVDGSERARSRGRRFAVTPGTGDVRRVLLVSGVLGRLCGGANSFSGHDQP
jgi:anti-anti-sigma factor